MELSTAEADEQRRTKLQERRNSLTAADSEESIKGKKEAPAREVSSRRSVALVTFGVGDRVRHAKHGEGTVAEKMEDGRTRVAFDIGAEHRYQPSSLTKLTLVRRAQLTSKAAARPPRGPPLANTIVEEAQASPQTNLAADVSPPGPSSARPGPSSTPRASLDDAQRLPRPPAHLGAVAKAVMLSKQAPETGEKKETVIRV